MSSPFENILNSSPSRNVRITLLRNVFHSMYLRDKSLSPLNILNDAPSEDGWHIPFYGRFIKVSAPERGEDGPYVISIDGNSESLIRMGIDKYAGRYSFHRISSNDEELQFTIEWQGDGQRETYAMSTIYFLQTLLKLIPGAKP